MPARFNARARAFAFAVVASLCVSAGARGEDTLNIATWGGAYGQSQEIAFFEPYAKETGTRIATEIYDGSLAKIKEMIDGGAIDVADVSAGVLNALCKDGLLETIATSSLGAAPSGESAEQDFIADSLSTCGVGSVAWAMTIAFDRQAFTKATPSQVANLLDIKRFPGKRASAERCAPHARACTACRWRRTGQCLYRTRDARGRRPRVQGARQDQGRSFLVGQRRRGDDLAAGKEGGDGRHL